MMRTLRVLGFALLLASPLAAQSPPSIALVKTTTTTLTVRGSWTPVNYGAQVPMVVTWSDGQVDTIAAGVTRDTVVLARLPRGSSTTVGVCVAPLLPGVKSFCTSKTYSYPLPVVTPPPAPPPAPAPPPPPPLPVVLKALGSASCVGLTCTLDGSASTGAVGYEWRAAVAGNALTFTGPVWVYTTTTAATRSRYLVVVGATGARDSVLLTFTSTIVPGPVPPPAPPPPAPAPAPVPPPSPLPPGPPPTGAAVIQDLGLVSSPRLGTSRRVRVYLPPGYATSTERYPVLYLHDGQNTFGYLPPASPTHLMNVDGTLTPLILSGAVRPVIVVAVDAPANSTQRVAEYRIVDPSRGRLYARMMVEELVPRIDATFRTLPSPAHRAIGGQSLGAVQAWYSAFNYPNVFGLVVSQSGVFIPQQGGYNHIADAQAYPGKLPFRLYYDRGTNDGEVYHQLRDQEMRTALLAKGMIEGQDFAYRLAAGAGHDPLFWAQRVGPFMRFLFPPTGAPPAPAPAPSPAPAPAPVPPPVIPPSPPPAGYPNEPAGASRLTERAFDAKVENGWQDRGDAGFSIVTDSTAPRSPANVGQALYSPRIGCGRGPIATYYQAPSPTARTFYVAFWLKMDPVWYGSHSNINKVLFIQIADGNRVYAAVNGGRTDPLSTQVNFQAMGVPHPSFLDPKQGVSWNAYPNMNQAAAAIPRGQWVFWEIVLVANTPGQLDGQLRYWLNGAQVAQYTTNIGYSSATETGARNVWQGVMWNPTYGGGCNVPADSTGLPLSDQFPVPQWMRLDHIRVSGKP